MERGAAAGGQSVSLLDTEREVLHINIRAIR